MKLLNPHSRSRCSEEGTAVVVVIALLAIILVYVAGNLHTLLNFQRELKLLEARHVKYLSNPAAATKGIAVPQPPKNTQHGPGLPRN